MEFLQWLQGATQSQIIILPPPCLIVDIMCFCWNSVAVWPGDMVLTTPPWSVDLSKGHRFRCRFRQSFHVLFRQKLLSLWSHSKQTNCWVFHLCCHGLSEVWGLLSFAPMNISWFDSAVHLLRSPILKTLTTILSCNKLQIDWKWFYWSNSCSTIAYVSPSLYCIFTPLHGPNCFIKSHEFCNIYFLFLF